VQEFSGKGAFLAAYGKEGTGEVQFKKPTRLAVNKSTGNVYVTDMANNRVEEISSTGAYVASFGTSGTGALKEPIGDAIDSQGNVWVADRGNNRIVEFSSTGTYIAAYGKEGTGELQFKAPDGIAFSGENVYVTDSANHRVEEITNKGVYVREIGFEGSGSGEFYTPEGIAADAAGNLYVSDLNANHIEEFSPTGAFKATYGSQGTSEGHFEHPIGLAVDPAGDMYVVDNGNSRIQLWDNNQQAAHDTKTIYYSPGTEAGVEACENRPQWAGLACRTEPVAQPSDSSAEPKGEELPRLPVVTTEYNMWYESVKTTEAFGAKTRTKTTSYEAERPLQQTIEAGAGKPVPAVSYKYSSTLGALLEQTSEGRTTSRQLNTLGQLESYTDAEGNATTYSYDQYGRPVEVDDDASKLDHMEARVRLHYEETTGNISELEDLGGEGTHEGKGVGAFKATYGPEGEITSETYPNAMTAVYGYNSIGEGTSLAYTKNNHCTGSECEWFKDSLTPSIHGETLSQESSLAKDLYRMEQPGRLAEVKETPTGQDCTARIYGTNEEGDRTSLTTRTSPTGECTATEGGEVQRHTYDEANRLTDEGVQYEPLGNVAKLPAVDAGGHALETEYYADGLAQSQTQGETTNTYLLDPEGRTRATETTVKLTTSTTVAHYPGPGGSTPSWTYNQTTGSWTRNITSFGGLAAVEESGKQAVLQLRDLQGNIIGTASLSETEGKPSTLERSTEYGVPTTEKPADKYSWLGTLGITPSLPSGAVVQDGATYVPQLGTPLQTATTPEPAVVNTVTPFTITVTPFTPAAYIEAQSKTEEGGTPSGNLPEPGGEQTDCTGMKACVASNKRSVKCYSKTYIGEKGGWVWAHAYGWCSGKKMPRASYLQACLILEEYNDIIGAESSPYCGYAVDGEEDPNQLYATVHVECGGSEIIYRAGLIFWIPGWEKVERKFAAHGWRCGETVAEATYNFFWALAEEFEGWRDNPPGSK
jgi:YD repeat-containing protein